MRNLMPRTDFISHANRISSMWHIVKKKKKEFQIIPNKIEQGKTWNLKLNFL